MATTPDTLEVRADPVGTLLGRALDLRVDDPQVEDTKGAQTDDARVMVPWPIEPLRMIDFWYGNPWMGAVGNLLGRAVASAQWDLNPREADLDGKLIQRSSGYRREQDADYAKAKAFLSREDVGREGVSRLDLPGLLRALTISYDQTANTFVEVIRDRGGTRPLQIHHLLPQFVRYTAKDGRILLYQSDPITGEYTFVPFGERARGKGDEREFLHQRQPNTLSSFYGVPEWYPASESVAVDNEHRKYLKNFFTRHTTPRYSIKVTQDPDWTGAQPEFSKVEQLYGHIKNFFAANAGDMAGRNLPLLFPGGIKVEFEPLDSKLEDPTFPNTGKTMRDEILAVRNVSLIDLGLPEGGYRATAEEQSDNFRRQVLEPFAAPAIAILNRILHEPEPSGLGIGTYDFVLKFDRVDDLLRRTKAVVAAVGGPVLSQVEGRQIIGYEAKGSSEVFMPVNVVPGLTDFGDDSGDGGDETDPDEGGE